MGGDPINLWPLNDLNQEFEQRNEARCEYLGDKCITMEQAARYGGAVRLKPGAMISWANDESLK